MRNLNLKPFLFILLVFSGVVWFISATVGGLDLKNFIDFMRPVPNVVTADLLLVGLFTRWMWRWRWLQRWLVPFPNLNGTWEGEIVSDWKDAQGNTLSPIPAILTVRQSFGRISCVMRTGEMESRSYLEGFRIDKEAQLRQLCYAYTSRPKAALRERSTPHDGIAVLNLIGNPVGKLVGEYWTQRHTTGTMTLTLSTRSLLDEMPPGLAEHPLSGPTEAV